jgi:hypothetical protein
MKKTIMNLAVALVGLFGTTSANATVYFQSDFNGLAGNTKSINGGALTLGAYGLPNVWGAIRNDALTIYGGEPHNGAASAALVGLGNDLAAGKSLLRMTGQYRAISAEDGTPWGQTAEIGFQNSMGWNFNYNAKSFSAATPDWTDFNLDLDLAGLATDVTHIDFIKLNFYLPGNNPGLFQVDNLKVETLAVAAIPEPSVASLLGFGVLGLVATRLRRRS